MQRRSFLLGTGLLGTGLLGTGLLGTGLLGTGLLGAGAAALAVRPARAQGSASARVLRYVPQADLTVIDPVMTTAYITRYHALAVWDQLYGLDSAFQPQPQMVEGHRLEDDGKLWTFTLRDGLKFHDGEPVRGRDCVASIKRWAARDPMGQALMARVAEMAAPDDKHFTIRLTRPFSLVLAALAKSGPAALVVMPERLAATDPYQSIKEIVGSGPFTFVASERVVGSRVVYAKNADYVPRANGQPDWFAGPKIVHFDRVDAWLEAPDLAAQKRIAADVQRAALDQVPYIPSGLYLYRTAARDDITGIIPGQFVFWNVRRKT